jgi:hypothetical protein
MERYGLGKLETYELGGGEYVIKVVTGNRRVVGGWTSNSSNVYFYSGRQYLF